jgi:hypothetical protein
MLLSEEFTERFIQMLSIKHLPMGVPPPDHKLWMQLESYFTGRMSYAVKFRHEFFRQAFCFLRYPVLHSGE